MSLSGPTVVASGGDTVQDIGGYRIHTFTTVGTSSFTVDRGGQVEVLVVAGGGGSGGGQGGAGGGGGVIYNNSFNVLANSINVTVGGGGSGGINIGTAGSNGGNSTFSSLTGFGGGGGGGDAGSLDGLSGGSGGGSGAESTIGTPGTGTPGQGNSGGAGSKNGGSYGGGGGGGAGVVGGNGTGINGGKGGDGLSYTISGSSVYYGGGGGGGVYNGSGTAGIGGLGGGGNGAALGNGQNGVANTGGGGGGGGTKSNGILSNGGSGIVIVRYLFGAAMAGPQPQIFLAPLLSYPTATGTPPSSDGTKLTFTRASSQYLNFGSQTFDMTKGFSVTCRFAFTGTAGNYERLFDFGGALNSASNNITIMRYGTGAGFRVWIVNGTTAQNYYDVNYGIVQGEITNLAAVYDPNAAQPYWSIYKNGIKLVPSNVTFVSKATGTRTLAYSYVGNSLFNWDAYTSADIYSLNVYNRVLTANELVGPVAPSPWGIFTSTPNGLTVDQAAVSGFALKQGYPGYGDGTYWIKPTSGSVAGLAFVDMTTDGGGWTLAYETVNARRVNSLIVYSVNNSSNLAAISFKRVAYSMNNFNSRAFTSFDSWSSVVANHRIAAPNDAFVNQRRVYNLNIVSSNTNIITGTGLYGALEIWPSNYGTNRNTSVGTYGSDTTYDINDAGANSSGGYGCFQVHDITNLRPVICWNAHDAGSPDIGFGPSVGNPDWTFTNKGATADFRVRVFVR
jgi:hypothetical protein